MMMTADMMVFRRNRLATLARLRRVNRAIARLDEDEYEAAQLMPADIRPRSTPQILVETPCSRYARSWRRR